VAEIAPVGDVAIVAATESTASAWLPPIEDFLDASPAAVVAAEADYRRETTDEPYADEYDDEPNELPPVEHFIDELPAVDHFAPDNLPALQANGSAESGALDLGADALTASDSGWLETDWQHYDWRAAAALGEAANDEASSAWATTDWGGGAQMAAGLRQTAAHAIAKALDEIAKRIRDGDLSVPGGSPMADPATIAATLSALLGVRR
jgi:hypothetical protein